MTYRPRASFFNKIVSFLAAVRWHGRVVDRCQISVGITGTQGVMLNGLTRMTTFYYPAILLPAPSPSQPKSPAAHSAIPLDPITSPPT